MKLEDFNKGDRVVGTYGTETYKGTFIRKEKGRGVNKGQMFAIIKRDDFVDVGTGWECLVREDGNVASASGFDDGIHNLELLEKEVKPPRYKKVVNYGNIISKPK